MTTVLAVALIGLVSLGAWLLITANRLDRLHIRTDAAWAALHAALVRRAVLSRVLAGTVDDAALRQAAHRAERAARWERETAENQLTRLLSRVGRAEVTVAIAEELAIAEHRIVLARRVHNDAVRDTLRLRGRRRTRWFRLAGTAASPSYFDIVDPVHPWTTPSIGEGREPARRRV